MDRLSAEATRLISDAEASGIVLRALGSVAVQLHCAEAMEDMAQRNRWPKDIDLVSRKTDRRHLRPFFERRGYLADKDMLVAMEGTRYLFRNADSGIDVDVWVDVLDLCHKLDVSDRLGPGPSLAIEDLVLSKLQIVELTANDVLDIASLLSTHELGRGLQDPEVIDRGYLCSVLGDDWGFWRTVTGNLTKIAPDLPPRAKDVAEALLAELEACPKTRRWKLRAKVGERMRWWQEVDIPRDTY